VCATTGTPTPAPVYEFRVTGEIGPVIRSAIPELSFGGTEQPCTLTGVVAGPAELERLLDRIAELGLDETEIRVHRTIGSHCQAS
jgi:hypothetical protein